MDKTAFTGMTIMALLPGMQVYLTIISVILFLMLAIQIWQMRQRCIDRKVRMQRLLKQVRRADD